MLFRIGCTKSVLDQVAKKVTRDIVHFGILPRPGSGSLAWNRGSLWGLRTVSVSMPAASRAAFQWPKRRAAPISGSSSVTTAIE